LKSLRALKLSNLRNLFLVVLELGLSGMIDLGWEVVEGIILIGVLMVVVSFFINYL